MTRPPFEVADIVRQHGERFLETHLGWVTGQHRRVLRAIAQCRTAGSAAIAIAVTSVRSRSSRTTAVAIGIARSV